MSENNSESWDKYQKLILKELKSLRYSNVATLNQYNDLYEDVSMLKKFKLQITTVMIVIQFVFGIALWYLNYSR